MRQEKDKTVIDSVAEQIKTNPSSFVPNKEELEKVISERETADLRLQEAGRVVILEEKCPTV